MDIQLQSKAVNNGNVEYYMELFKHFLGKSYDTDILKLPRGDIYKIFQIYEDMINPYYSYFTNKLFGILINHILKNVGFVKSLGYIKYTRYTIDDFKKMETSELFEFLYPIFIALSSNFTGIITEMLDSIKTDSFDIQFKNDIMTFYLEWTVANGAVQECNINEIIKENIGVSFIGLIKLNKERMEKLKPIIDNLKSINKDRIDLIQEMNHATESFVDSLDYSKATTIETGTSMYDFKGFFNKVKNVVENKKLNGTSIVMNMFNISS